MCRVISGIAVKAGEGVKVYTLSDEDSHEKIREEYGIGDGVEASAQYQTPVELIPVRGVEKLSEMDFVFDDRRPSWWTDEMTAQAERQLFSAWRDRWDRNTLKAGGHLHLGSLTSIPEGVTLKTGGYLDLDSLTSIPEGVTLKTGGYLNLGNLTSIAKKCRFQANKYYIAGRWVETSKELRKAVTERAERGEA